MEENLLFKEKLLGIKLNWRQPYIYGLWGFFSAAAMAYEGVAALVIAFAAAILSRRREEIAGGAIGSVLAVAIWQRNAPVILSGLAAIAIFAVIKQYSKRKWLLWQQSVILGCLVLAGDCLRIALGFPWSWQTVFSNVGLTMLMYYTFCQLLLEADSLAKNGTLPPKDRLIYPTVALIALLVSLNGINLGTIMLQRVLLVLAVLVIQYYTADVLGLGAALFFSLVCVLSLGQDPVIIGYVGVCALAATLGEGYGKIGIAACYVLAGVLLGWVVTDFAGLAALFLENILAAAIFLSCPEFNFKRRVSTGNHWQKNENSFSKISQAIGILGQAMAKPMVKEREKNMLQAYSKIYVLLCHNCRNRDYCWQSNEEETIEQIEEAYQNGLRHGVQGKLLSEEFAHSCRHAEAINEAIIAQIMLDKHRENYKHSLQEYRQICADELKLVSKALRNLQLNQPLRQKEQYLRQYLSNKGLPVQYVETDVKNGNMTVNLVLKECIADCQNICESLLSESLNREYILDKKECSWQDKYCRLYFKAKERIFLAVNGWQRKADGEKICGDLWRHFKLDESRECVLLIDGMGVGEKAYQQSLEAAETLEQMLRGEFALEEALELTNNHLLLHNESESFITLELLMIDTLNLQAELYKAAGSVSYLLRDNYVEKIEGQSLPLGILNGIECAKSAFKLKVGDRLLLLTDGLGEAELSYGEILPKLPAEGEAALKELFGIAPKSQDDQSAVLIDIWSIRQDG